MIHVKLTTCSPRWPLLRQTPGSRGIWGDCVFHVNDDTAACDWWVVHNMLHTKMTVSCPPENTLFITAEPPELHFYDPRFCRQFAHVISCHPIPHPHLVLRQQGLPWIVGVLQTPDGTATARIGYDELSQPPAFVKDKELSVITSSKTMIEGHRQRLTFVGELQRHFADRISVFGRGFQFVEDKWDAIQPYRYHVTIENSTCPNYVSEKISDVFLAGAFPLYHGCSNLADYFPPGSFATIDIRSPASAIDAIEQAMAANLFEVRQEELAQARDLVLHKYNLFAVIAEFCSAHQASQLDRRPLTLRPATHFGAKNTVKNILRPLLRVLRS